MKLFCREQRKAFFQIEAQLPPEDRIRPYPGAIAAIITAFIAAVFQDVCYKIEILLHSFQSALARENLPRLESSWLRWKTQRFLAFVTVSSLEFCVMEPAFELFQHTADIGIRVIAPTREGLIAPAAEGLYAVMGTVIAEPAAAEKEAFSFAAEDAASVLRLFLAELLFLFDAQALIGSSFEVTRFSESELIVSAVMQPLDPGCSSLSAEIKAVTYHQLALSEMREADGTPYFEARIIVDV